ncbi:hypothetical protein ACFQX6_55480 [Streptosporangium lutulentum]
MPGLMAAAYALVDNAAGVTCREAMAAGVPVISYRPIPGHGRDGARAMALAGLSVYARDAGELLAALDRFGRDEERDRQVARGRPCSPCRPPSPSSFLRDSDRVRRTPGRRSLFRERRDAAHFSGAPVSPCRWTNDRASRTLP